MSPSSDKVAAPTNGHRRALTDSDVAEGRATSDRGSAIGRLVPVGPGREDGSTSGVSPTQLAVGFGVLAALIVVLLGRRRRD